MLILYSLVALTIAYFVGNNAKKNGYGFWRSFVFMLLLFAVVLAFLAKQLKDIL